MEGEEEKPRSETISGLLVPFVGPLSDQSHCHICLDSWYSNGEEFLCSEPCRIEHKNCQCQNIVIGKSCLTQWLLEKDTCPMCRGDLIEALPPHLRRPPPNSYDDEFSDNEASDSEDADVPPDSTHEEHDGDEGLEIQSQSWLQGSGNYLHSTNISSGELFTVANLVDLFAFKTLIETFKTEAEKTAWFATLGTYPAAVWDRAYRELVEGRPQILDHLYTADGPICIYGVDPDEL